MSDEIIKVAPLATLVVRIGTKVNISTMDRPRVKIKVSKQFFCFFYVCKIWMLTWKLSLTNQKEMDGSQALWILMEDPLTTLLLGA